MEWVLLATCVSATVALELYCPNACDMNSESGNSEFKSGGWMMTGNARVSTKTSWNLLGGYVEFDVDASEVLPGITTTFYTISPQVANCGLTCYCDGFHEERKCIELDVMEMNGNCALATTTHTHFTSGVPGNRDCDQWGCSSKIVLGAPRFHVKAEFAENGTMTVLVDGTPNDNYYPIPSNASNAIVVETMNRVGAAFVSSQWHGWVPNSDSCPEGNKSLLPNSTISISNIRVLGTVKLGPEPSRCSAPRNCIETTTSTTAQTTSSSFLPTDAPSGYGKKLQSNARQLSRYFLLQAAALSLVQLCMV